MSNRDDHIIWRRKYLLPVHCIPQPVRVCLMEQGSLTYHLRQRFRDSFYLELKGQVWAMPMHAERNLLKLRTAEPALIRKVVLKYKGIDLVYAQTVIPRRSLTGKNKILQRLKARSIGTILFSGAQVTRKQVQYASIQKTDMPYQYPAMSTNESAIWGRRSLFELNHKPLLITELFLPTLGQLLCAQG